MDTNEAASLINAKSRGKFDAARAPRQKIKKLIKPPPHEGIGIRSALLLQTPNKETFQDTNS